MSIFTPLTQSQHNCKLAEGDIQVAQSWDIHANVYDNHRELCRGDDKTILTQYGFIESQPRVTKPNYSIHCAYFRMNGYCWHQYVAMNDGKVYVTKSMLKEVNAL